MYCYVVISDVKKHEVLREGVTWVKGNLPVRVVLGLFLRSNIKVHINEMMGKAMQRSEERIFQVEEAISAKVLKCQ